MTSTRVFALLTVLTLAACGGGGSVPGSRTPAALARHASDTATGMPGDTASGMPGDTATGMPGAQFGCAPVSRSATARCTIAINVNVAPQNDAHLAPALIPGWQPADLQRAYALPSGNAGGLVAVVDAFDDPSAEADLAVYRATFGLPPCTGANGCFRKLGQSGSAASLPPPDAGWSQEIALDLAMVSAACPTCRIALVEANSALIDDLGASVDTAAQLGAAAISNSYYAPEWANELGEDAHYTHPGTTITVSSGDLGRPSYPAASAHVLAVGGTSLGASGETPWAYSGHGCSSVVPKPAWQAGAPCGTRAAVDVAAVADPQHGVAVFSTASGGWIVAGGTSAAAPLIAGAAALAGTAATPEQAYAHPAAFFRASGPYDALTGLGPPRGIAGL